MLCPNGERLKDRRKPICDVLDHSESNELRKIFGDTTYEDMVADVVDYSASPVWAEGTSYAQGDVVSYDGAYFIAVEAIQNDSTTPDCSTSWRLADKFSKDCYNTTWAQVSKIVAWVVFANAVPFYPNILDVGGFADRSNEETPNKISYFLSNVYKGITAMKKNFLYWNDKHGCISLGGCETIEDKNQNHRKVAW